MRGLILSLFITFFIFALEKNVYITATRSESVYSYPSFSNMSSQLIQLNPGINLVISSAMFYVNIYTVQPINMYTIQPAVLKALLGLLFPILL